MPITKSAAKRMRQTVGRRLRNMSGKSVVRTADKKFLAAVSAGDKGKAKVAFFAYCSVLDKVAKRGIIPGNNADRKKSRASARLAKMA
jgi:small subunit ribosomal protein S20